MDQLILDIERGGGECSSYRAKRLITLATRHHRLMEDHCNGVELYDEDGEALPALAKVRAELGVVARNCGCGVKFSGDPRGATVKLVLPNGKTNDWGNEGWCVPTRE